MISGIVISVLFALLLFTDGGGVYDPDPSADARHKMYRKQKRKEFWMKVRNLIKI
jgi:hypothetical protein